MAEPRKVKVRFLRVVKRDKQDSRMLALYYFIAILIALAIGALFLASVKVNPFKFYRDVFTIGMINNAYAYKNVQNLIILWVPLLITSLALSLAFRMRYWNIGGEGQFIVGAITAAAIAFAMGPNANTGLSLVFMTLGGGLSAAVYGLIAAALKVKFGTNETLLTLMLNYIALNLLLFFAETKADWNFFLSTESNRPIFRSIPKVSMMPAIPIGKFGLNISLIFAILLVVALYIYLTKTKQGYEVAVVGDSPATAKYAGMKVGRIIIRTVFISAFFIGVAGAWRVSSSGILSTTITNNVGWTGIVIAWIAQLNPIGIFVASLLISILHLGSATASAGYAAIDANFANILQGIILFLVLISHFFIRYKVYFNFGILKRRKTAAEEKEAN